MTKELLKDSILTAQHMEMLRAMANNPLGNYAGIPGLTSSLLGGPGPGHGSVRMFDCSRFHRESLVPHSHRFDVLCLVLRGYVVNHIWTERPGDSFVATEYTYMGAPGYLQPGQVSEPASYAAVGTRYDAGEFYSMKAAEIHSIEFSRDACVLFFEGPQVTSEVTVLEPFVDGRKVPTFQVQPWMYQRAALSAEEVFV